MDHMVSSHPCCAHADLFMGLLMNLAKFLCIGHVSLFNVRAST